MRMGSLRTILAVWLAAGMALWGCSRSANNENAPPKQTLRFENPRSVLIGSAVPSATETLFALGLGDQIAAVTNNCGYPPEALTKEKIGDISLNYEKIAALGLDAVIGARGFTDGAADRLNDLGIRYVGMEISDMDAIARSILELSRAFAVEETGMKIAQSFEDAKERAALRAEGKPRPRVFWVQWNQPLSTVGPGNFHHDLIQLAGGENIASDLGSGYAPFSEELLTLRDPEAVLVPNAKTGDWVRERFPSLSAVQSNRVIVFQGDETSRPGPRLPIALDRLSELLHGR